MAIVLQILISVKEKHLLTILNCISVFLKALCANIAGNDAITKWFRHSLLSCEIVESEVQYQQMCDETLYLQYWL